MGQPQARKHTALRPGSSPLVGALPRHRLDLLQMVALYEPTTAAGHLVVEASRLDRLTGKVVESRRLVCHALPVTTTPPQRDLYLRELCLLMAPYLQPAHRTLRDLDRALEAMAREWDFLATFGALEDMAAQDPQAPVARAEGDLAPTVQDLRTIEAALALYAQTLATTGFAALPAPIQALAQGAHSTSPLVALDDAGVELLRARAARATGSHD